MPKKITLTNPHVKIPAIIEYRLVRMTVQYDAGTASIDLVGDGGQSHTVIVNTIPNTTQENAILALVNNGVLAGIIGDV